MTTCVQRKHTADIYLKDEFVGTIRLRFFRNAVWGSLFAGIACGMVGTYVVSRRLVFISGGITHASFGGLGIGFYFGLNPILSAMAFSVLSAFGIEWLSTKQGVREDSAIAVFWSLGMALGIIFTFLSRICTQFVRISFRQYSHHYQIRYLGAFDSMCFTCPIFSNTLPCHSVCFFRRRVCTNTKNIHALH